MTKPKKSQKNENQDTSSLTPLINADDPTISNVVDVQVDGHETKQPEGDSLIERAKKKMVDFGRESIEAAQSEPGKKEPKWKKYQRNKQAQIEKQQDDITTLVSTVLALGVALWSVPADIKPNDDELDKFSEHLAGIVYRHTPVGALSEDALDLVGMVAVLGVYLTRTSEARKVYSVMHKKEIETQTPVIRKPIAPGVDFSNSDARISPTPFEVLDPNGAGKFLNEAKDAYDRDEGFHS